MGIYRKGLLLLVFILIAFFLSRFVNSNSEGTKDYSCSDCNVVFIAVDALQASHVHHLGYERDTTPTLDKLAADGISFSQAISPASWTVPTYMSIFTSTYPSVHGLVNRFTEFSEEEQNLSNINELSPGIITLAQELKKAGYVTGGFTGDSGISKVLGYDKGFDIYTDELLFGGFENSQAHAFRWLDENKDKKFFMLFHGYDTHGQFDIGEGYKSRYHPSDYDGSFQGTKEEQGILREEGIANGSVELSEDDIAFWRAWYDGKIRDADDRLSIFLEELDKRGLMENTIFVIFSDHGTEFAEHARFDHGHTLYDELIRVPLIIKAPNLEGGRIVSDQVTTIDIAPTVFDLLGIDSSEEFSNQVAGTSLMPHLLNSGTKMGRDVYSETDYRDYTHKRAIRTADGWKYIITLETMQEELYDLNSDPGEQSNLINIEKDKAELIRDKLREHVEDVLGGNMDEPMGVGCLPAYANQCK